MSVRNLHKRRPAETTAAGAGITAALLTAIARHDYLAVALIAVVAVTPAIVTWLKTRTRSGP